MSDAPTLKTDAILALIPGGQTCDPQLVADELRGPIAELERELAAERALADRLALILDDIRYYDGLSPGAKQPVTEALAAWNASRDPNNLEGAGPTEEERRENASAIQAMSFPERIDLMFRGKEGGGE